MRQKLSKTDFLIARECIHNAWLKRHQPEDYFATPPSAFDLALLDTGNDVDILARQLFPGGDLIERGDTARTNQLIAQRAPILYQPVFVSDRFTAACDILVWNEERSAYDLYEVKSSTGYEGKRAKQELYLYDIAYQVLLLRELNVPLGRSYLVHLNKDYLYGQELDIATLFSFDDLTDEVEALGGQIAQEMAEIYQTMQSETPLPSPCGCILKGRSNHCTTFAISNPQVPVYSIHDITRIGASKKKLAQLVKENRLSLDDVPSDFPLSPIQANQVRVSVTGVPEIHMPSIAEFLSGLEYPLAFLDYETYPAAIPRFPGYAPYDQIPFQFSLDVLQAAGADLSHHEFLHIDNSCPDTALITALAEAMPDTGSIITWNQSFEKGVHSKLATRNPSAKAMLEGFNERIVDLMEPFSKQAFVHPDFKGSTSIKHVLPVLAPQLSYKSLAIQEGATATTKWNDLVTGNTTAEEAEQLRSALLEYCALDTEAMVEIWHALMQVIEGARKAG